MNQDQHRGSVQTSPSWLVPQREGLRTGQSQEAEPSHSSCVRRKKESQTENEMHPREQITRTRKLNTGLRWEERGKERNFQEVSALFLKDRSG